MHLRIILTRLTQNVHQMALRVRLALLPAVHQGRNFQPRMRCQLLRHAIDGLGHPSHRKLAIAKRLEVP